MNIDIDIPDLILTSDWHLREDQTICRTDDFWQAQWNKVKQVAAIQEKYDCPVVHAGDLYHYWKPSPNLLRETITRLPKSFFSIFGNHDLPQNNPSLQFSIRWLQKQ